MGGGLGHWGDCDEQADGAWAITDLAPLFGADPPRGPWHPSAAPLPAAAARSADWKPPAGVRRRGALRHRLAGPVKPRGPYLPEPDGGGLTPAACGYRPRPGHWACHSLPAAGHWRFAVRRHVHSAPVGLGFAGRSAAGHLAARPVDWPGGCPAAVAAGCGPFAPFAAAA